MNPFDEVTEKDIEIMRVIKEKHNLSPEEVIHLGIIQIALMSVGYGRNSSTARMLRAMADLIESPIATAETIEAKMKGGIH